MTQWALQHCRDRYDEINVTFANTGQEREETLEFVDQCDKHFGFGVVWLEGVVHHGERKGSTHKVVDYATASRDGKPFEEYIKKYGIPNRAFPQCTRELKTNPMKSYRDSIGWTAGTFHTAIGIRADEIDRMNENAGKLGIVYPLVSWCPMTKPDINAFWAKQPFRLKLKGYEGNCAWCWKKTLRKHLTLMAERPQTYDFPERMEQYSHVGPQECERVFFLGNRRVADIKKLAAQPFVPFHDDAQVYPEDDLDRSGGCSESCEIDHD